MDNEIKRIRLRIIIVISSFLALIAILSIVAYFAGIDRSIPSDKTSLNSSQDEQISTSIKVYNMELLANSVLSSSQVNKINQSLNSFVDQQKVDYVSIESGSVNFISRDVARVIRFNVKSKSGSVFRVEGSYVTTTDISVSVFDSQNKLVYGDSFDFIDN